MFCRGMSPSDDNIDYVNMNLLGAAFFYTELLVGKIVSQEKQCTLHEILQKYPRFCSGMTRDARRESFPKMDPSSKVDAITIMLIVLCVLVTIAILLLFYIYKNELAHLLCRRHMLAARQEEAGSEEEEATTPPPPYTAAYYSRADRVTCK